MRPFLLVRREDVSGVSGTGVVAQGVVFATGKAVLSWVTERTSVAVYDSIEVLDAIHGHAGRTYIEWLDEYGRAALARGLAPDGLALVCPAGCGCRLGTADADRHECACAGPCCFDSWHTFMEDVLARPDQYREWQQHSQDEPFPTLRDHPPTVAPDRVDTWRAMLDAMNRGHAEEHAAGRLVKPCAICQRQRSVPLVADADEAHPPTVAPDHCGDHEPHEPHDDEGTASGAYTVHTCPGTPTVAPDTLDAAALDVERLARAMAETDPTLDLPYWQKASADDFKPLAIGVLARLRQQASGS